MGHPVIGNLSLLKDLLIKLLNHFYNIPNPDDETNKLEFFEDDIYGDLSDRIQNIQNKNNEEKSEDKDTIPNIIQWFYATDEGTNKYYYKRDKLEEKLSNIPILDGWEIIEQGDDNQGYIYFKK